jgi:hypothetical protein
LMTSPSRFGCRCGRTCTRPTKIISRPSGRPRCYVGGPPGATAHMGLSRLCPGRS